MTEKIQIANVNPYIHILWLKTQLVIRVSNLLIQPFSRYWVCFTFGGGRKLKNAGIKTSEITNNPRILIPATSPNSLSNVLLVKKNTPKPIAAVKLVKKVTMPILSTMRSKDFILFGFL